MSPKKPWERNLQVEEATPAKKPWERDYSVEQPEAEKEPETSTLGAVGLGALQGATFGFADEIEAGLKSVFGDEKYETLVQEARQKYKKAQEERPGAYLASELGTGIAASFIPFAGQLGGAATAARLGSTAVKAGAIGGGIGAIGTSEADLLAKQTPEAAAELAKDIGIGAAGGAAFGKAGELVGKSKIAQRIGKGISESKIAQKGKELLDTALSGGKKNIEQGRMFIGKPEKVKEVEGAFKAGGFGKVKEARENVKQIVRERGKESRDIKKLSNEYNQTRDKLQQEIGDIQRSAKTMSQEKALELRKDTAGMQQEYDDVKMALSELGPKIDAAEENVRQQVETLSKSLDNQSANAIQNLYENQLNKINELGKHRDDFMEKSLSNIIADEADAQSLQDAITDMYSIYKNDYETAIKPVFRKILKDEPRFTKMANIIDNPETLETLKDTALTSNYTKADMIKMLENAKRELYTPLSDKSPTGVARRNAYQILNEKLNQIAPDEYNQFNRELNKMMTTRDVLEDSPLLKGFTVTKTGEKGGQIAETRYLPVTERPDIEKLPQDYLEELQSKGFDTNLLQRQEEILKQNLTKEQLLPLETMKTELTIKSNALKRQINELRTKAQISAGEEQKKLNELINKKTDELNLYRSNMTLKLSKMREELADKFAEKIDTARDALQSVQEQAKREAIAYNQLYEAPLSADETLRLATVGLTGKAVPYGIGRAIRPSPMNRIKVYNAIAKRFKNPALTAAISPRIGQALSGDEIISLANTHNVDPNELTQALQEQGMVAP